MPRSSSLVRAMARSRRLAPFVLGAAFAAASSVAQCTTAWLPGAPLSGLDGPAYAATAWDPDGAGPLTPRWIVGGDLFVAANVRAERIAAFDPATGSWSPLGDGLNAQVRSLAVDSTGALVAGGYFGGSGATTAIGIARWNGNSWTPLGSGLLGGVLALTTMANGDLVAGGAFTIASGAVADGLARWSGTTWATIGSSGATGLVLAVCGLANGDLVVGGSLSAVGGVGVSNVARWNGTTWQAIGAGIPGVVASLAQLPNGDVLAGTDTAVRRWNGATWQPFGPPLLGNVRHLAVLPNGDVIASGDFATGGLSGIAIGNGTTWTALASGIAGSVAAATPWSNGDVFAAGAFLSAGGTPAAYAARWNGTAWNALASGFVGPPTGPGAMQANAALELPNGDLVVGGNFAGAPGTPAAAIARWNGSTWSPLGTGLPSSNPYSSVLSLALLPNGDLLAGGEFSLATGGPADGLARWNGSTWAPLGSGIGGATGNNPPVVVAMLPRANGELIAAGAFSVANGSVGNSIARWNGSTWAPLGSGLLLGGFEASVVGLLELPNGDLLVAGYFDTAGGAPASALARWNGSSWAPWSANTVGSVSAMVFDATGALVVARLVPGVGFDVARWNGSTWTSLGTFSSPARSLLVLPNGDLLAGGNFTSIGGVTAFGIARFDGASWSEVDGGAYETNHLLARRNGEVVACGRFTYAGSQVSPLVARLASSCPALATSVGNGCAGSAGPLTLTTTTLPWLGGAWTTRASNVPANAIAVRVFGLVPLQVPLALLLPQALPGCDLLTTPDLLDPALPVGGAVITTLPLPNVPSLLGGVLLQQLAAFELDAQGNLLTVTSSGAQRATIGVF